jgi:hypothetical protein
MSNVYLHCVLWVITRVVLLLLVLYVFLPDILMHYHSFKLLHIDSKQRAEIVRTNIYISSDISLFNY